jgi:hypothetical protein
VCVCVCVCVCVYIYIYIYIYIHLSINFITDNVENFQTSADVHIVNTRHKHRIHKPTANLSCFQKGVYYAGIKIVSNLPSDPKGLMNENSLFKTALKRYLNTHSPYPDDEYLLRKE